MMSVRRICVYCGSSPGIRPEYRTSAQQLGRLIVRAGLELVYGGASVGLMGTLADTVMQHGGRVFVESTVGKGTTIGFELPVREVPAN
jgi:uncharacterized protein (TIGR00730 family)